MWGDVMFYVWKIDPEEFRGLTEAERIWWRSVAQRHLDDRGMDVRVTFRDGAHPVGLSSVGGDLVQDPCEGLVGAVDAAWDAAWGEM